MEQYYSAIVENFNKLEKPEKLRSILGTVAAVGLATYFAKKVFYRQSKSKSNPYGEIPTPEGAMYYLGHVPNLGKIPAHTIADWHKKYGPIIRVKMGVQDWVFISEPALGHEVFVAQGAQTSGRPYITWGNKIHGEGNRGVVFNDYNKNWKNARTAILNILSPKSVDGFDDLLQREANHLVDTLIQKSEQFGQVDPAEFIRCSSVNIILATAFGIPGVHSPEDPLYKEIVNIIETSLWFANVIADPSVFSLSFQRKMIDFKENVMHPLLAKLIKQARESETDSLIKKLDLIKDEHDIDEQNIRVLMSELLSAGADTVFAATLWSLSIMCNHFEIQLKLQNEVDAFISRNGRIPTFADRLELPYFNAFLKECLRFKPPALFSIPRKASKDVVYKNYIIPKDTIILSNIHAIHSDSNTYVNPEKFMPERFLNDSRSIYACSNGQIQNRDQFVFGWGRRICPGIYLAENELFNTLTRVVARCDVKPALSPEGKEIYPNLNTLHDGGATVHPLPYQIRFALRESLVA
ncbi:cytochrome P450 [Blakeslea trispora]|nr:cytochrome P450 [Blakeslea trispora]